MSRFSLREVRLIRSSNLSTRDLAKMFDCQPITILLIKNNTTYFDPDYVYNPSRNLLTDKQVLKIRELDLTVEEIAERFQVSNTVVINILKNKTYVDEKYAVKELKRVKVPYLESLLQNKDLVGYIQSSNLSLNKLSKQLNIAKSTLSRIRKSLGYHVRLRGQKTSNEEIKEIVNSNLSVKELSVKYKLSRARIYQLLQNKEKYNELN
jgi:predicted DNA-binding protein YlxM (UPF0122 family)